tara:strand:+ start:99 stop:1271 length:1173 start_codon:yes stop_codon:yes gene_type:complete
MFSYLHSSNNNIDLSQGNKLLQNNNDLKKNIKQHLDLINTSSSKKLGSIIEALDSDDSTKIKNSINLNNVTKIEDEFNRVLINYTRNYNLLLTEILQNHSSSILQKYAGKNVVVGAPYNGKYYVNNYGFTYRYNNEDEWNKRPSSCGSEAIQITADEFSKLPSNNDMPAGKECGIAGYNIEDKTTGDMMWVDIKGVPHSYSKDIWKNRSESCKGVPAKKVNHSNIVALSPGKPMSEKSICNVLNVDPKLLENLSMLNEKLISLAKELLIDTEKLSVTDKNIKDKLNKLQSEIQNKIKVLEKDKSEFSDGKYNISNKFNSNLSSIREDSYLKVTSNYTMYLIWLIICIAIILLVVYIFLSDKESFVNDVILLIFGVILLYKIIGYFYKSVF